MKASLLPFVAVIFISLSASGQSDEQDVMRWNKTAENVTIVRDNWGIPHVYAKRDAAVVFGLMYAQCEDDFDRIEMNYLEKLGRLSMIEGEKSLYNDLYVRLILDENDARRDYDNSPAWLKQLLNGFADGINFYLYKHPEIKPKLLTKFEPWYPLLWTDGSIGAISTGYIGVDHVRAFYSGTLKLGQINSPSKSPYENLDGSNGFAISASNSETGNAMLYINPHVSLYFRPEVHMISEEGLNAYGAVTWGQFFVYQGFNEFNGWMHTSSDADVSDMYLEKIVKENDKLFYEYEGTRKAVSSKTISINYKTSDGIATKDFITYATHHGPVMSSRGEQWISVRSNNRSIDGLIQSWQRTKSKGFEDYKKIMDIKSNTSNNTVYADNKGNIAYWHGNFMPKRNPQYDWSKPVDGTTAATEWQGLHTVNETVHLYNPKNGWIQNCNSTPFTAAGVNSPKRSDYPIYMAPDGENYRGINAVRVFKDHKKFNLDALITAGYDRHLPGFEKLIGALEDAYDKNRGNNAAIDSLADAITLLKNWDFTCHEASIATTLAVEWGQTLISKMTITADESEYEFVDQIGKTEVFLKNTNPQELLASFSITIASLKSRYGKWQIKWGEINRFQRISGNITNVFSDDKPSLPVGFTSSAWGMLPAYTSRTFPGTTKRYGLGGNSFICAVEFGPRVSAKSLLAGGESGNPSSPHFNDQGEMFTKGIFKDVLYYREDVMKHVERSYHPGM
ncbi:MAG: penicillin acylase family protein [Chryseolinea sp.]